MRVCLHKLTQRLREAQSDATPGTLLANVAAAGDNPDDFEERNADAAEFAALLEATKPPPIDLSDPDNHEKAIKALGLVMAQWSGKTIPQLKAAFKTAWDSLP